MSLPARKPLAAMRVSDHESLMAALAADPALDRREPKERIVLANDSHRRQRAQTAAVVLVGCLAGAVFLGALAYAGMRNEEVDHAPPRVTPGGP
jgi:hypothetical protein